MCGICGMIEESGRILTPDGIKFMTDKMTHRGPDDEGIFISPASPKAALGHRRLSIIDLNPRANQPMPNEDKSLWLVCNGEIYNYKILRRELEEKGHKFISESDNEVIIHLYEEKGAACVKELRGMFAFAIWDEKRKMLFMARDRAGQKPLLYSHRNGRFLFASEFAALLGSNLVEKRINRKALDYYLTFGYIPAPLTVYEDVFKLPPAHTLVLKDGRIAVEAYWMLDYSKKLKISPEEASGEILRLLKDAVRLRLYSDVPLGAFLSGGIDSSTVVALMSQESGRRVKTFSIGFEEKDYDELKYARSVAGRYGTEHHEFVVKPDALGVLPLLVERYGEPYADSSSVPTYYVSKETKRYVTVALNGDGGDELFAGYERYQAMRASEIYHRMPGVLKGLTRGMAGLLPDSVNPKNKLRRIKRFFDGADFPFDERYLRWIGIFNNNLKNGLYSEDFKTSLAAGEKPVEWLKSYIENPRASTYLDKLLFIDTHTYLPEDLLVKVDITSMANSLEARSPFLDHELMAFVASLPPEYKMNKFIKKYILKKTVKDLLPSDNIQRKKMGFGLPVGDWFRGRLKGFLEDTILSRSAEGRGYFKAQTVREMVEHHIREKRDYTFQLWALLMLELWHKRFID